MSGIVCEHRLLPLGANHHGDVKIGEGQPPILGPHLTDQEKLVRMGILALIVIAAVGLAATPGWSQDNDPDIRRRLSEALERSLEQAKFELKRKSALLQDVADSGWAGFPMGKDDEEWRRALDAETYAIARDKRDRLDVPNDEIRLSSSGILHCGACGAPLFETDARVSASTPGLHFDHAHDPTAVVTDRYSPWSLDNAKVELRCGSCGAHLGHVDPGDSAGAPLRFVVSPTILSPPPAEAGKDP